MHFTVSIACRDEHNFAELCLGVGEDNFHEATCSGREVGWAVRGSLVPGVEESFPGEETLES